MVRTQVHKNRQPKAGSPKSSTDRVTTMQARAPSQNRIRERAYELYESRGRVTGQDEQDWFSAEQEIINRDT
jgi:hypothetical protein